MAAAGRVLARFGLPQTAALALPDGTVASAGVDGIVRLVAPDGTTRELAAGSRPVAALAAAPDGGVLAAASIGGSVGLWSVAEARLLRSLDGPGMPVWSVAFAADGRTLWTGGQDRVVRRWDADTGAPLGPLAPPAAGGRRRSGERRAWCAGVPRLRRLPCADGGGRRQHGRAAPARAVRPAHGERARATATRSGWRAATSCGRARRWRTCSRAAPMWPCRGRPCPCSGWRRRGIWRRCCASWRLRSDDGAASDGGALVSVMQGRSLFG